MPRFLDHSLQFDLNEIGSRLTRMAALGEKALLDCQRALEQKNPLLAYGVIFRDIRINRTEEEIERMCHVFLARHRPAAGPLRFAYSGIRVNLELERVGDYAKSIAKQTVQLLQANTDFPQEAFSEMAHLAIPMLRNAVKALVEFDADLAIKTIDAEEAVDTLRDQISLDLYQLQQANKIPLEALTPLLTIARRFERVSDQAKSICQEALFVCTGQYPRHLKDRSVHFLFLDDHNSCRSQMAEAIAHSYLPEFSFTSAGLDPKPIDERTVRFLKERQIDISNHASKGLGQIPELEHFQIIVGLAKDVDKAVQPLPRKTVYFDWNIEDPSLIPPRGTSLSPAYDVAFQMIHAHLYELSKVLLGDKVTRPILRSPAS